MAVKQVCVRMKNQPGSLHQVTEVLKLEGVNIRAISVLDPGEDALVRMMVDDPERACNALGSKGFDFFETEVVAVEVPDHPGGAARRAGLSERGGHQYSPAVQLSGSIQSACHSHSPGGPQRRCGTDPHEELCTRLRDGGVRIVGIGYLLEKQLNPLRCSPNFKKYVNGQSPPILCE